MTSDESPVLYEQDGKTVFITLNRPNSLNAINPPLRDALDGAMERARDDSSVRIIVLRGSGRAFCAGADLKWRSENPDLLREINTQGNRPRFIMPGFDLWKPLIASVHGYAVGGGLELAMACDVIVASDNAVFGLPEPKRGLAADGGGIHRMMRDVPRKIAMELILTGKFISAEEAKSYNIVNRVVPNDDLASETLSVVEEMLQCSPQALKASKQTALIGVDKPFDDVFPVQVSEFTKLKESNDFVEGPLAFAEKREPVWEDA